MKFNSSGASVPWQDVQDSLEVGTFSCLATLLLGEQRECHWSREKLEPWGINYDVDVDCLVARSRARIIAFSRSVLIHHVIGIEPAEILLSFFLLLRFCCRNAAYFRPADCDDTEITDRKQPDNNVQLYRKRATTEKGNNSSSLAGCGTVFQNYFAPRWLHG